MGEEERISLLGTGDFTHPTYFAELRSKLEPLGNGLFRLKKGDQGIQLYFDDGGEQYLHSGWEGEADS